MWGSLWDHKNHCGFCLVAFVLCVFHFSQWLKNRGNIFELTKKNKQHNKTIKKLISFINVATRSGIPTSNVCCHPTGNRSLLSWTVESRVCLYHFAFTPIITGIILHFGNCLRLDDSHREQLKKERNKLLNRRIKAASVAPYSCTACN